MNITKIFFFALLLAFATNPSEATTLIPFEGEYNFSESEFKIVFEFEQDSSVAASARKVSENNYKFTVDIEHLKTPVFDLLSNIESSVEVIDNRQSSDDSKSSTLLRGKVWSEYSLVDFKPVNELTGGFEVNNRRLHLTKLSFGSLNCNGYIDLVQPYKLDLSIDIADMGMTDFLNFWSTKAHYDSAGAVSGNIKASGTLAKLLLKGSLESRNGFVQKLNYDSIILNIEGVYPNMEIAQSTVSKSDGVSFSLDGPFNLSDRTHFKKQIKDLNVAPLVSDSGSEREWTIKRFNQENDDSGMIEIKYRLREGDALGTGTTANDQADMLGF